MTSEAGAEQARTLLAALDGLSPGLARIRSLLRSYIQEDSLTDVCVAREAGRELQAEVKAIAAGLQKLSERAIDERAGEIGETCRAGAGR